MQLKLWKLQPKSHHPSMMLTAILSKHVAQFKHHARLIAVTFLSARTSQVILLIIQLEGWLCLEISADQDYLSSSYCNPSLFNCT